MKPAVAQAAAGYLKAASMSTADDLMALGHDALAAVHGETVTAILNADDSETEISALVNRLGSYGSEKEILVEFDSGQLTSPENYRFSIDSKVFYPWEIITEGTLYRTWLYFEGETITYWAVNAENSRQGIVTFAAPVQIKGYWMDRQEQFRDQEAQENISDAVVRVQQDLELGGYLYRGTSATSNPINVAGARVILGFDKNPNRLNTTSLRKAFL